MVRNKLLDTSISKFLLVGLGYCPSTTIGLGFQPKAVLAPSSGGRFTVLFIAAAVLLKRLRLRAHYSGFPGHRTLDKATAVIRRWPYLPSLLSRRLLPAGVVDGIIGVALPRQNQLGNGYKGIPLL